MQVTGGLVCTTDYFAQFLEGPPVAIDELMHSIEADTRHTDVTVLEDRSTSQRSLPDWDMAYNGASSFVAHNIIASLQAPESLAAIRAERLRSLIVGLSTPS